MNAFLKLRINGWIFLAFTCLYAAIMSVLFALVSLPQIISELKKKKQALQAGIVGDTTEVK